METQPTVTLKGREYQLNKTDFNSCPYELVSGRKTLTGIRNLKHPDLIICIDKSKRRFACFFESTMREVNLL